MSVAAAVVGVALGLVAGVRHAFEPDHLAAVSTLVAGGRSPRRTVAFAAAWGTGHGAVLVLLGGALLFVGARLPPRVGAALEAGVGVMLVVLGVSAFGELRRRWQRASRAERDHGHGHDHGHGPRGYSLGRALTVGVVHGLAGTGALTAVAASELGASPLYGVGVLALYAAGATLGMVALAGALGLPLARVARSRGGVTALLGASGALSLAVGMLVFVRAVAA